jgi:hypothetical protein
MAGIRESGDIDIVVSRNVLESLKQRGWKLFDNGMNNKTYVSGHFEAFDAWIFPNYERTFEDLLANSERIEGIAVASLHDVREWKLSLGRQKDVSDVRLMDEYLQNKKVTVGA